MKTTNRHDDLPLTGDHCQCPTCREYFNSTAAFDKHRRGPMTARRCESPSEIGMALNKYGYWITGAMPECLVDAKQKVAA